MKKKIVGDKEFFDPNGSLFILDLAIYHIQLEISVLYIFYTMLYTFLTTNHNRKSHLIKQILLLKICLIDCYEIIYVIYYR